MICSRQANLQQACLAQQFILEAAVNARVDPEAPMKLAILNNAIAQGDFEQNMEVTIEMSDSEKTKDTVQQWMVIIQRMKCATIEA